MKPDTCVILCSAWPFSPTGTAFAVRSILPTVTETFDRVEYVAVSAERGGEKEKGEWAERVGFRHVAANAGPKWRRFLRSLCSPWPGTAQRYVGAGLLEALRESAEKAGSGAVLVVLDAPLYWPLLAEAGLRSRFSSVVLWCQNVNADVFTGVLSEVGPLARLSWRWEIERLRRFEERCLADADVTWAITEDDRDRFREVFGHVVDGVLGVRLDASRFETEPGGAEDGILYLGSFDIRKSFGIAKFVRTVFPRLRESRPGLELWIGGKGSEAFDVPDGKVHGLGHVDVDDEAAFLARGRIFVNPQESGSGLKLKSLHALAAGKVLLTTRIGVQGIPGVPGRDFLVSDDVAGMAGVFGKAVADGVDFRAMGEHGRALALSRFGEEAFDKEVRALFDAVLERSGEGSQETVETTASSAAT